MKSIVLIVLALILNDPKEIAKINSIKKEAESAYLSGDYELAIAKYNLLTDSIGLDDDQIKLNLGHAHFHLGDTSGAKMNYGKVGSSTNNKLRSIAYQQLGVMSKEAGKLEPALQQLKSAIKADPSNKDAIYDYEVVKKLLEDQKKQEEEQKQDQENKDQENKDGEDEQKNQEEKKEGEEEQEKKDGENQEKSDQEKSEEQKEQEQKEGEQEEQEQEKSQEEMTKEKLEEMGISEEKARQLLEAMRQSEIKYLQNQKRKATKRPPSGKPDW